MSKIITQVHGKLSKMRDRDAMSEKIVLQTPEVPRRRRVELGVELGRRVELGAPGDYFPGGEHPAPLSPGNLRRPKSAMDFRTNARDIRDSSR